MQSKTPSLTRRHFLQSSTLAALAMPGLATLAPAASSTPSKPAAAADPLKVAVVTGGHLFDVQNFHRLFRAFPELDVYIQHMTDFAGSPAAVRDSYHAVVFYIMLMEDLTDAKLPQQKQAKAALEHLGDSGQGIVVLHHALLAYPNWRAWSDLVGIADRKFGFDHDQTVKLRVADTTHPISRGIPSWEMVDETYSMADAGQGSQILLTTDHPKSMKTIGWTRQFKESRVFCLQSGHDNQTWVHANFREVLRRGILWSARRLD
jgi:type 1 glutamine amidotransferase